MTEHVHRAEWLPRPLALLAIGAAAAGLLIHALVGFRGAYLTYASGVWLSLARDLAEHGVFFRDLSSDLGYGGTRYFPLFFVTIAGFLELGFPPAIAGWLAGSTAFALLVTGAQRVARESGAPRLTSWVAAAAAAGPYFAIEAVFGVRADVMAAGLNLWGVGLLLPVWRNGVQVRFRTWPACMCFALAFATKVTALAIPATMIIAAFATGRARVGARLGVTLAGAIAGILFFAQIASAGRAFRVWSCCMFAGSDSSGTLAAFLTGGFLPGLLNSHLVVAAMAAALIALAGLALVPAEVEPRTAVPSRAVPTLLWIGASVALGLTLSSPGTVPANQVIEWLAISMLTPLIVAGARPRIQRMTGVAIAIMAVWMAAQNVSRTREMRSLATAESVRQRQQFVESLRAFDAPILSESALWPVLAGREVVVPDPFAARLVLRSKPELERQLIDEIERRRYTRIILEFDPTSPEGRGMYEFAHFGQKVITAIENHYRFEALALPNAFVFAPRPGDPKVDLIRRY